jgi:endosialidase-like protein
MIDLTGQLGTVVSSLGMKADIEAVGERSRGLHALRPVSFRYRVHPPDGPVEYGLIAEEVAEVYPELVVRDAAGAPETVRYHLLPVLLLNELQRQERALAEKDRELQATRGELAGLAAALVELTARLARLEGSGPIAVKRVDER